MGCQYEKDKQSGWAYMPANIGTCLENAYARYKQKNGASTLNRNSGGNKYIFDFERTVQVNTRTQHERRIRFKYDLPRHWLQTDEHLLETHLQHQPSNSLEDRTA